MTGPMRVYVALTIAAIVLLTVVAVLHYIGIQQQTCYPNVQLPTLSGAL